MRNRIPKTRRRSRATRDLNKMKKGRTGKSDLDMKKRWENFKDFTPALAIILCFVVAGLTTGMIILGVQSNNITNYAFGDDDFDYRYYTYYDDDSGLIFTDTIYVSSNGDNTTGGSWDTAYNEIGYALSQASTDSNNMTLIILGLGTHDVNTTGNPTFSANLFMRGISTEATHIVNTHASATSIIKFTGTTYIENLQFKLSADIEGVLFYGISSHIHDTWFNGSLLTAIHNLTYFSDTIFHITESEFLGESTATYGIGAVFDDCSYGQTSTNRVCFNYIGWNFINTDYVQFKRTCFVQDYTAIQIDSDCVNLYWFELVFSYNDYNTNDTSSNTYYDEATLVHEAEASYLNPSLTEGLGLTGHATADTYGAWFNFTYSEDRWYHILGTVISTPSDETAYYRVQIAIHKADNHGDPIVIGEIFFSGSKGFLSISNVFQSGILSYDTVVRARLMTSDGGGDTVKIFERIAEI